MTDLKIVIKSLVLQLTNRCNLSCCYCYCPKPKSAIDMALETMKMAVRFAALQGNQLHIQLTGGEPCLNKELVFTTINEVRAVIPSATIAIQTNATLLDEEICLFLKKNQVNVGVSIDGPPSVHEKTRGNFPKMLAGLECLEHCDVPWRATTVVCDHTVTQLHKLVLMISRFCTARGIALDVLTRKDNALKNNIPQMKPEVVRENIINMMDVLKKVNVHRTVLLRFREADSVAKHANSEKNENFCHACKGESMAVYPDGSVYPCSQLCGEEKYFAGTVNTTIDSSKLHIESAPLTGNECLSCSLQGKCPGDCPSRLLNNNLNEQRIVCEIYRTIFDYQKRNGI